MGIVTRITDLVNANIHAVLDKAEQPEKMLRLVIQELEETLVEARSEAAKSIADKKGLNRKAVSLTNQINDWLQKAETALIKDREDLAKQALIEKSNLEEELAQVEKVLSSLDANLDGMNSDIAKLQSKLTEAKTKKKELLQRQATAVSQIKSRQVLSSYNVTEMEQRYEMFAQKVDAMESKVEAFDLGSNPSLENEFKQLEADSKLNEELEQLKVKVAKSA